MCVCVCVCIVCCMGSNNKNAATNVKRSMEDWMKGFGLQKRRERGKRCNYILSKT